LKKKIVHIISNLSIGGAQLLMFDILSNIQKEDDIDITLITIDSGFYIEKFKKAGIKVIDIKSKGLVNPSIFFRLKKILKEIQPDIVHTHLLKADFYGRLAAKKIKIPFIFSTCHNDSTVHTSSGLSGKNIFDKIDNWVIKDTNSYIVAISNKVREYLIQRAGDEIANRVKVIYNGVDIKKEEYILNKEEIKYFRASLGFGERDFIISVVGRLEEQKGHLRFLEAVKELIPELKLKIVFVGEGSRRDAIQNFIDVNQLSEYVVLAGFQPETQKYIEIADLVIVPSLWEGFGIVVCEGMIKNKIVLASNVGGIPEIIDDGVNGFLYNINDANQLKSKIIYIRENMESLDNIKFAAKEKIKLKFDIIKNSTEYKNLYLTCLANKHTD